MGEKSGLRAKFEPPRGQLHKSFDVQVLHTKELKCLIVDIRRDVVTCAMLRPLRNIFHYSAIKMVAITLVVTVSLVWHMQ